MGPTGQDLDLIAVNVLWSHLLKAVGSSQQGKEVDRRVVVRSKILFRNVECPSALSSLPHLCKIVGLLKVDRDIRREGWTA